MRLFDFDRRRLVFLGAVGLCGIVLPRPAAAQNSSLYGASQQRPPLTLQECSWTFQPPEAPRTFNLQDLIFVRVDQKSVMTSNGIMDRKKKAYGDLILKDWILLKKGKAIPDPQTLGDPHIRGELDNKLQSQGILQTQDKLQFNIACSVVDIRPNGNLVIEGHTTIMNNEEEWDYGLTGEVRPDSIMPKNIVLSENVANMRLVKRERGHVRDSYRRGWMLQWLDKWQPF